MSPQTEAFKMVYSDLLKKVQNIAELEDRLSSDGIVPKDPNSSEVKPLKRKLNLLDKIGSVITASPEKFEEILHILENHVPEQVIAEMKSLQDRFYAVDAGKLLNVCIFSTVLAVSLLLFFYVLSFQCHKCHEGAIHWPAAGLPLCGIVCSHNIDVGGVCDVDISRNCVNCPNQASFIVSPCQCDYCEGEQYVILHLFNYTRWKNRSVYMHHAHTYVATVEAEICHE